MSLQNINFLLVNYPMQDKSQVMNVSKILTVIGKTQMTATFLYPYIIYYSLLITHYSLLITHYSLQ